jgi:hypothetical protein
MHYRVVMLLLSSMRGWAFWAWCCRCTDGQLQGPEMMLASSRVPLWCEEELNHEGTTTNTMPARASSADLVGLDGLAARRTGIVGVQIRQAAAQQPRRLHPEADGKGARHAIGDVAQLRIALPALHGQTQGLHRRQHPIMMGMLHLNDIDGASVSRQWQVHSRQPTSPSHRATVEDGAAQLRVCCEVGAIEQSAQSAASWHRAH